MRALGIDFGGTKTALAIVDGDGNLIARDERPALEDGRPLAWSAIGTWAARMLRSAGLAWSDLAGAGAIVPGIYDPRTGRAWAPNLWGRDEIELRDALGAHLEAPLTLNRFRRPAEFRLRHGEGSAMHRMRSCHERTAAIESDRYRWGRQTR